MASPEGAGLPWTPYSDVAHLTPASPEGAGEPDARRLLRLALDWIPWDADLSRAIRKAIGHPAPTEDAAVATRTRDDLRRAVIRALNDGELVGPSDNEYIRLSPRMRGMIVDLLSAPEADVCGIHCDGERHYVGGGKTEPCPAPTMEDK